MATLGRIARGDENLPALFQVRGEECQDGCPAFLLPGVPNAHRSRRDQVQTQDEEEKGPSGRKYRLLEAASGV